VTPTGTGKQAFWQGLQAGKSAVRTIEHFDVSSYRSQTAAVVADFDPTLYMDEKRCERLDRFSQFSVAAVSLALHDAGLSPSAIPPERLGVALGTALGGVGFAEDQVRIFQEKGLRGVNPLLALSVFCGAGSCNVAIQFGAAGPVAANSNSCASGTIAFGEALNWIRRDLADVVLTGGAEAPLYPLCYGAFAQIRAMSTRNDDPQTASRPFDRDRDGFVMGEGAAMLVVEELTHALERGATIYAEVAGYGLTNDAHHMTAPRPDGLHAARAMNLALRDAQLGPADIDHLNAHGSSTPLNDKTETLAIKQVFGPRAYELPISGIKGHHGHALGAAGAVEAAAGALSLHHDYVPPTVNLQTPDPECDLDYVPGHGRHCSLGAVLSNSFGFGGINACLVLKKVDG
jgi:3-oxoacyl-[acyl-carrier-protein] synthase II